MSGWGCDFGPVGGDEAGCKQDVHGGEDGPAVAGRAGHAAERVGESGGDDEDGEHLQEVRERRGVFEGVGAVGVEEAAAVGAEHLDGFLRSDGALADGLGLAFEGMRDGVGVQVLGDALGDQEQRVDDAGGQQDVEQGAGGVDPEVADGRRRGALDAADEGDRHDDADGGGKEVVGGQAGHLGEIAHGRFGRVELPVGVGGETGGGVPGQVGPDGGEVLGVPGSTAWRRSMAYVTSMLTAEKPSMAKAYSRQFISLSASYAGRVCK